MVLSESKQTSVVCVDDQPEVRAGLRLRVALEPDLRVVGELSSADGLVPVVRATHADVVLLDIDMPGPDPFEAIERLREDCPDVRVIMVTAQVSQRNLDAAIESGAAGFFSKADSLASLMNGIRQVAEGRFAFGERVFGWV